jgi:hypothetical protein
VENDDTAHQVLLAVAARSRHLPLAPHGGAVFDRPQHARSEVRNGGKDLCPVLTHLVAPHEAPRRMKGSLVDVVGAEAVDQRLQVVRLGRLLQPPKHLHRTHGASS